MPYNQPPYRTRPLYSNAADKAAADQGYPRQGINGGNPMLRGGGHAAPDLYGTPSATSSLPAPSAMQPMAMGMGSFASPASPPPMDPYAIQAGTVQSTLPGRQTTPQPDPMPEVATQPSLSGAAFMFAPGGMHPNASPGGQPAALRNAAGLGGTHARDFMTPEMRSSMVAQRQAEYRQRNPIASAPEGYNEQNAALAAMNSQAGGTAVPSAADPYRPGQVSNYATPQPTMQTSRMAHTPEENARLDAADARNQAELNRMGVQPGGAPQTINYAPGSRNDAVQSVTYNASPITATAGSYRPQAGTSPGPSPQIPARARPAWMSDEQWNMEQEFNNFYNNGQQGPTPLTDLALTGVGINDGVRGFISRAPARARDPYRR